MGVDWSRVPPRSLCRLHLTRGHLVWLVLLAVLQAPLLREVASGWVFRVLGPLATAGYVALLVLAYVMIALNVLEARAEVRSLFGMLRSEGERALARGDLGTAHDCFARALACQPRDTPSLLGLARTLAERGDTEAASDLLQRARRQAPRSAMAAALLGSVMRRQGRLAEAETVVREALTLEPELAEAHVELGHLDVARCDLEHAAEEFRRAARSARDPALADAASRLLARVERRYGSHSS